MNENAKAGLEEYQRKLDAGEIIRPKQKTPIEASDADPNSKAKAIKAMCYHCVGGGDDGKWRDTVRNCTSGKTCPLYKVRPFK